MKRNAVERIMPGTVWIGTSGWHYTHWIGPFYPPGTAAHDMLGFYAERFTTVELNNSFYRLPTAASISAWCDATLPHFRFACKASRYTTHVKRLRDAPTSFEKFFSAIEPFGQRLGPILFQTPPHFILDEPRLEAFVAALPEGYSCAFEFRDPRWFSDGVREILARRGCAFCIFDIAGLESPHWLTADFAYLRLHGPGGKYQGSYDDEELRGWARLIRRFVREDVEVYCYFDNDEAGHAPRDAMRLRKILGSKLAPKPSDLGL
jgi:uncharacterized protein YecE (DUF72 family)